MKTFIRAALLFLVAVAPPAAAELPGPTIRVVTGYAPGGSSDLIARLIANRLSETAGRTFIVENRPGAAGTLALSHVAEATPDGRTIMLGENGALVTARTSIANLRHDPQRDLAFITLAAHQTVILAVRPGVADSLPGLVARARANPGRVTYGSVGTGNPIHLFGEDLGRRLSIDMLHVPYRGGGPLMNALLAGEVDFSFLSIAVGLPQIRSGMLVPLAVLDGRRHPALPDVPAANEIVPGFEGSFWFGFHAPLATPPAILNELNAAIVSALKEPSFVASLAEARISCRGEHARGLPPLSRSRDGSMDGGVACRSHHPGVTQSMTHRKDRLPRCQRAPATAISTSLGKKVCAPR
jgi:tripartite-type tricarboxylate transporter receptor subunit TctC